MTEPATHAVDPFALLGLPRGYVVDRAALDARHRELSKTVHPDRQAQATPAERRAAAERASQVNEALRVLRDPVRRAEALFRLAGVELGDGKEPAPPQDFLFEVLELREALADARRAKDLAAVERLERDVLERARAVDAALDRTFATPAVSSDAARGALPSLAELRYWRRFLDEVEATRDELDA